MKFKTIAKYKSLFSSSFFFLLPLFRNKDKKGDPTNYHPLNISTSIISLQKQLLHSTSLAEDITGFYIFLRVKAFLNNSKCHRDKLKIQILKTD